jgi:hypothetical protein
MDKSTALAILEAGIRKWCPVPMGEIRFVYDKELLRTPEGFYTHPSSVHVLGDEEWEELLHPERSWIAATLILDAADNPIMSLDVGPRVAGPKDEIAPGVDIAISLSFSPKPLKFVS